MLTTLTYIGVGIAVVIFILLLIFDKTKKKVISQPINNLQVNTISQFSNDTRVDNGPTQNKTETEIETVSKEGIINAVVLDDESRSFGERHVDLIKGKDYGRPVQYFNNQVFYLHRFKNGVIEPVPSSPFESLEHSPGETYRAVRIFDYIKTVFGRRSEKDHTKLIMIIIAICVVLFIGFMAVNSGGG